MKPPKANPELAALIEKTSHHEMTDEEKQAQRESWVRGEMGIGTDADEERHKKEHGF